MAETLKKASFEEMAGAWNTFDEALEAMESGGPLAAAPLADLFLKAVHHGIKSLSILYSGAADIEGKPEILLHLIREKHPCFGECDSSLLQRLNDLRDNGALYEKGGALFKKAKRISRQVEILLQSVESYNFHVRRDVYYTKEACRRDTRRWRFTVATVSLFLLVTAFLYLVYRHENPLQEYVTKGQFFWLTQPGTQETEEVSLRFKVFADGEFHDYTVSAVEPISLVALRLDPCDEKGAQVYIESLEIDTRTPQDKRIFSFDSGVENWYAKQDVFSLKTRDGALFIRTTGRDAAVRIDDIPMTGIVGFKLRMKVVLHQSFLQWIFS